MKKSSSTDVASDTENHLWTVMETFRATRRQFHEEETARMRGQVFKLTDEEVKLQTPNVTEDDDEEKEDEKVHTPRAKRENLISQQCDTNVACGELEVSPLRPRMVHDSEFYFLDKFC